MDEILDLIESVSEGFPTYSLMFKISARKVAFLSFRVKKTPF